MLPSFILLAVVASGVLAAPQPQFAKRATAASGAFNVLSMNVAGLPAILNSNGESGDKTTNTMIIGQQLAALDYGVVHVQEDFNYHATLYKYDNHPFRIATSGGVPFSSGLNTLSKYDWTDFVRAKWKKCSDAPGNDCLTPKACPSEPSIDAGSLMTRQGFTFMRLRLDEGVYIDFINMHTDVGTEQGDEDARTSNVHQVADFITANSGGNPVIVFGDTNSRYTRTLDNIRALTSQNGLTDAWVDATGGTPPALGPPGLVCPDGVPSNISCEVVDKIFYRGNVFLSLTSTGFFYDTALFLIANGSPVADHNPIRSEFIYTLNENLRQRDLFGGPHGTWFSDLPLLPTSPIVASINLRGGSRLDSFGVTLTSGLELTHGGSGGNPATLKLEAYEYVTSVQLCAGTKGGKTRNFYAKATTSAAPSVQAGSMTGTCQTFTAFPGFGVVGSFGQDRAEVDQLGLIYAWQ